MINAFSKSISDIKPLRHILAVFVLVFANAAYGQSSSDYVVVDDVVIYYAVLPAEMLRVFPSGSEEGRMHGGIPSGKHIHHVQIALFNAKTNERITDFRVAVTVAEVGLGSIERDLEPFQVGDAVTYGNYFDFQKRALYEIKVRLIPPNGGRVIEKLFEFKHQ